ncbi:MAG TPA: hypothetical protein VNT20_17305 [Flavisolibacter sp.]|jgi:hypothetical protein|nr:hypothetical protein [Flavisolibacter sp.]
MQDTVTQKQKKEEKKQGDQQDQDMDLRPDYSKRNRTLEWRSRWLQTSRNPDEKQLEKIFLEGLEVKRKLIERQKGKARNITEYAESPAGTSAPATGGSPWYNAGPRNINGRVKCLAVHPTNPDIVYAGAASGGVWKTTNGGQSWVSLWNEQLSLALGGIAIAPSNTNIIYAGTGEGVIAGTYGSYHNFPGVGVYVSTDGGITWTLRNGLVNRRITKILVASSNANVVYVAGQSGFEKSTDGGLTWTMLQTGQISDAVIDPSNDNILYIAASNNGILKNTSAGTGTWTLLATGPTGGTASWVKLAIGVNGTNASNFLVAKTGGTVYTTVNGGTNWTTLAGSHGSGWLGWCDLISVAPDDQNVIIAGGVSLDRTTDGGTTWPAVTGNLHSDNHMVVFAPSDPNTVYNCSDGGLYKSTNKGASWFKASHGMVVTQFYDIGNWNNLSTVMGGGTQDNGTNMTTGGLTYKNIFGADGGYFVVDPTNPRVIYLETQSNAVYKSINGGAGFTGASSGLSGSTPWVGVLTIDPNNNNKLFTGRNSIFKTLDGCATAWTVCSQMLAALVSSIAVAPSNSNRVYAGTGDLYYRLGQGHIYRTDDGAATSTWTDKTLAPLPSARPVMDISVDNGNENRVIVCYGGTNTSGTAAQSVFISTNGGDAWTDISNGLPNVGANAVVFDPNAANTIYIGTDVGIFRTTDLGVSWTAFDNGIPNVVITDLQVDAARNLLFAATFGRGMFKLDITPALTKPVVDLYLRDSILDTGERFPSPSGLPNPNNAAENVYWWQSPDMKVDNPPLYVPDAVFDGVEFDEDVQHDDPKRGISNRFYLQVHNRGWQNATNVSVRAFFADASAGLPSLPNALVPPAFNLTSTANWTPIGAAINIPVLEPNRPVIVSWDWTVPAGAATHSCLMAVISSGEDPITTTETNVNVLIGSEKRVALKNLHVINGPGPSPAQEMVTMNFHNQLEADGAIDIIIHSQNFVGGTLGLLLEKIDLIDREKAFHGVEMINLRSREHIGNWYNHDSSDEKTIAARNKFIEKFDSTRLYEVSTGQIAEINGIKIKKGQVISSLITLRGSKKVDYGEDQQFTIMQRQGGKIVGGSTFELRLNRPSIKLPVTRIRIMLEKVEIRHDHDWWIKGKGEIYFNSTVMINHESCRTYSKRLPERGVIKVSDKKGRNQLKADVCLFDGYIADKESITLKIQPMERDTFTPDDKLALYQKEFNNAPGTWVGNYGPDDEVNDKENLRDWKVWYRIESLK